jgi:hypothetical protein
MADVWVCANCRSVNNLRAKQCYQCRTPKDRAAVDPLAIESTSHGQVREVELPTFHSSSLSALVASVLILAIAALQVVGTLIASAALARLVDDSQALPVDVQTIPRLALATLGVGAFALLAWSFWLSRVVRAMPALGLGYPAATGLTAFIENFIPGLNLLRIPAIVRDVVHRLEPRQGRGDALIFAAWIGLIGGLVVPRLGFVVNMLGADTLERAVRNAILIESVAMGLVVVGAIFLVALIWWIEVRIRRRRKVQLAELAGHPSTGPAPAPERAPAARATAPRYSPISEFLPVGPPPDPADVGPMSPAPSDVPSAPVADQVRAGPERAGPERAGPPFAHGPAPAVLADAGPGPAPAVLADAGPGPSAVPSTAPRLGLTVQADGRIVAELEGESETATLDDVRAAATALARAGGSATVTLIGEAADARWNAREVARALRAHGVPTTFEE